MTSVYLKNVMFYCSHGILAGEEIIKENFEVNAEVMFNEEKLITSIHETIDYSKIYEIIKQRMNEPELLLETLAMNIGQLILSRYMYIKFVKIDIQKMNPPIKGINGSVGVCWFKNID